VIRRRAVAINQSENTLILLMKEKQKIFVINNLNKIYYALFMTNILDSERSDKYNDLS